MTHSIDILGVGNAIVDTLVRVDDTALAALGLSKSTMQLIDAPTSARLSSVLSDPVLASGGSVANTIAGIASFGGRARFVGKVADDSFGARFADDLKTMGVVFDTPPLTGDYDTGRCLVYVTPDGERTMCTHLGAANRLSPDDIIEDEIASAGIVFLEGYLFDPADAKRAFAKAASFARTHSRRVALTLSDVFCVEGHRDGFRALIDHQVDILFANEAEIMALYQTDFDSALNAARTSPALTIVTRGAKGSIILAPGGDIAVPAAPVPEVVDTTGAGDLFAAGFLYGLSQHMPLARCGALASAAAAEVISHTGARPLMVLKSLIKAEQV